MRVFGVGSSSSKNQPSSGTKKVEEIQIGLSWIQLIG